MENKENDENLEKTVRKNVNDEFDNSKFYTNDKGKHRQKKSKKKQRKKSSISSRSSSSSDDSSDLSSDSSRSSSESSERSRSRKHKKKSKKHKKHKSKRMKENKSKRNKKEKSSAEPKKSKWTTVNPKSESPLPSRSNVMREENKDLDVPVIEDINEKAENKEIEMEKPNFKPSGILAKETNTVNGVVVKFTEPLDAAVPSEFWRLYPFKDNECQDPLHIHKQSSYLVGKDKRISHILVNHPSCSRQHAVIQYREYKSLDEGGKMNVEIKPYIMDLESTNGTFLNKTKIEPARYYELKNYDIINFGFSTRDYIITKVSMN